MIRLGKIARLGFVAVVTTTLCGCPNVNTYGTPRTVDPGEMTHTISIEGLGYANRTSASERPFVTAFPGENPQPDNEGGIIPLPPSYQFRLGVAKGVDVGAHVNNMSSIGVDVKLNPVRGVFDMGIAPGIEYDVPFQSAGVFVANLPLLLGINIGDEFTVVATPGLTMMAPIYTRDEVTLTLRGSLGFNLRLLPNVAIHPEVSVLKPLNSDMFILTPGIAVTLGSLPSYDDL